MIVVSNTSPLTNLAAIGQLDLLRRLFARIVIPDAVRHELEAPGVDWSGKSEVAAAEWIEQRSLSSIPLAAALQRDLDLGEAESIALAVDVNADIILLDEREGRRAARGLGLRVSGVLGVLLRAKDVGLLDLVRPQLDALIHVAGFYLTQDVVRHVLALAGEEPPEL